MVRDVHGLATSGRWYFHPDVTIEVDVRMADGLGDDFDAHRAAIAEYYNDHRGT